MKAHILFLATISFCAATHALAVEGDKESHQLALSLRGTEANDALQGEIIGEGSITEHLTGRVGLSFFLSEDTGLHGGIEGGLRGELPGRIAPFIGAGMFLGSWTDYELADSDGIDNDDDNIVDEPGEEAEFTDYLSAVYPELGIHIWLTESVRISASTRYYITTKGRDSDRRMTGIGLAFRF